MQQKSTSFQMNKWYFDGISDAGETFIGYNAEILWKSLKFHYASSLEFDGHNTPVVLTNKFREHLPQETDNGITWTSKGLSLSADWHKSLANTISPLTLYESEQGKVVWHCLLPLSKINLHSSILKFIGLGYVEHLSLTLFPWSLPIRELRWGRFLSPQAYIVWIEWRGEHPLTLVHFNGTTVKDITITDTGLSWNDGTLEFDQSIVLREGPLIKTVLTSIPGVRTLFPNNILYTNEKKWRSRGKLSLGQKVHRGWVIHETVRFNHE